MRPLTADDPRTIGEFRLHARLGAGGMGRVYLGYSPGGRAVAVKVIHPQLARNPAFSGRFKREVAAALAVNGGYAAPVVAAGADDNPPWLATAYVAGPSLQEVVTEAGPLPQDAVLRLAAGLAEALLSIHAAGLVHRDLKPGNVLLAEDGPRVIDFGIAKVMDSTVLTSTESVMGTPQYMSPEQAQGQQAGPPSDVFSLGSIVYFAATGATPFGSGHPAVLLYRIVHAEPDLMPLPPQLHGLVSACLRKDPFARPSPMQISAALMPAAVPGDSAAAYWPWSVAQLIRDHQAKVSGVDAPYTPPPPTTQTPVTDPVPPFRVHDGPAGVPTRQATKEIVPGLRRRQALAALAGAATAGAGVGAWALIRAGSHASPGKSAALTAAGPHLVPGRKLWSFKTSANVAGVAADGGVAYAGGSDEFLYAFDADTGALRWRRATPGSGNSVVATAADTVVTGSDHYLTGLDSATGQQLWNVAVPNAVLGLIAGGRTMYAAFTTQNGDTTGGVTAYDARSGEQLWTFSLGPVADEANGLALADGIVYATPSDLTNSQFLAVNAATGQKVYEFQVKGVKLGYAPPVLADGVLYASTNDNTATIYARHAADGRALWRRNLGRSTYAAYLSVASGILYATTSGGGKGSALASEGGIFALDAATGKTRWAQPIAGGPDFGAAVAGNTIYTGSNNGVLDAWHATTGARRWSYTTSGTIGTTVVLAGGIAYFASDATMYAVGT